MHLLRGSYAIVVMFLAQQLIPVRPPDPFDAHAVLSDALDHLHAGINDTDHFVYLEDLKIVLRNNNGKIKKTNEWLYEVMYIHDMPYKRLLKRDGKPLSGKELAAEQTRYDDALSGHFGLGNSQRGKTDGYHYGAMNFSPWDVIGPDYTLFRLEHTEQAGGVFDVIDASLRSDATASRPCPWHYQIWVKQGPKPFPTKVIVDTPPDSRGLCQNETGETSYAPVDGVIKPQAEILHFNVQNGKNIERYTNITTWTNYRRFETSVQIRMGGVVEPETTPDHPIN